MSIWTIYLIFVLIPNIAIISGFFAIGSIVALIIFTLFFLANQDFDYKESERLQRFSLQKMRVFSFIFTISLIFSILFPTSRQMAKIFAIDLAVNNERIAEIGSKSYGIILHYLEEFSEKEKDCGNG